MSAAGPLRVLVWQWGRFGAGPRVGLELAEGLDGLDDCTAALSLSTSAEIVRSGHLNGFALALPVETYRNLPGYVLRVLTGFIGRRALHSRLRALNPDVAICAMPGPLDLEMAAALNRLRIPFLVVVHDADRHPGDGSALQMALQRKLIRRAAAVVVLSAHVAARVREQRAARKKPLLLSSLPPFVFGPKPDAPLAHGGPMRLLFFGRLLPYKGLDLLADALADGVPGGAVVRVVGEGPDSPELERLGQIPGVAVENRWVPESEIGALIAWSDAMVLPYREASQSGVAAAAIAARRWVVSTRVGGLVEQFKDEPLAVMCDASAIALREAIADLVRAPPGCVGQGSEDSDDPYAAWRQTAAELLSGIRRVVLPPGAARRP